MTTEVQVSKRALVTGGAGQDGWYLIELLLSRGYEVFAHSRRPIDAAVHGDRVNWYVGDLTDVAFLQHLLSTSAADEIYNLAAVSRPALSWDIPIETARLNALVPQSICEFIRNEKPTTRLFQASSSEIYGDGPAHYRTKRPGPIPDRPMESRRPTRIRLSAPTRTVMGCTCPAASCSTTKSPRRPLGFVSQKIAHAARRLRWALPKRGNWTNAASLFCPTASVSRRHPRAA